MSPRLPLWIVTGFLGSGKSTLIRSLIRLPELGRLAVVINEFGETGIDHDIIEASSDDTFMLEGGCLCCMVRGDLNETLTDLVTRRTVGELPPFDGVVVETSGLADPGPVIDMLATAPSFEHFFQLRAVVTVIDALNARQMLATEKVARAQLEAADLVIITKTDLCSDYAWLVAELGRRVPGIPIHSIVSGATETLRGLVPQLAQGEAKLCHKASVGSGEVQPSGARHDLSGISAHTVNLSTPVDPSNIDACISFFSALAGPQLLRAKALIVLPAPNKPVVIQAVQEMVYRPTQLTGPHQESLGQRMVVITRNIDAQSINNLLADRNLPQISRSN